MPILRKKEIRSMPSEDRKKKVVELQTELVRLKTMVEAGGSIDNPSRIRELHKTIARLLTIENEPKTAEEKKRK